MAAGLTGRKAERDLHKLVLDCCVDDEVLKYILPNGLPNGWESSLWDYKRELPNLSGREQGEENISDKTHLYELIKDVVSFHNSYGGYILAGIDQYSTDPCIGCTNLNSSGFTVEKLNEQVQAFTRSKIICRFRKIEIAVNCFIGLLHIPMRQAGDPVCIFTKGSPERGNNKACFKKGDIYARIEDSCVPGQSDVQVIQFLCSERRYDETIIVAPLENTLPTKDPNLIRFVGRSEYLLNLWSWFTDRHAPVKVLTALGGTGKTSIAYEFARQIVTSPPAGLEKVIWLTAKKQSFSVVREEWVKATRTDFESVDELCVALASEVGGTAEELDDSSDRNSILDVVLDGLSQIPAFVVIDDVDSLPIEEQADLFSTIQNVGGRSFSGGSRFLLTSRLELGAGESQRITVKGFGAEEFSEYAQMVAQERSLSLDSGVIQRLHKASLGSPIFCASILRLVSLGTDLNKAIHKWKEKEGDTVRRFAFSRELEQLTDPQARTLYALCILGQTTQLELTQVLSVDDGQIISDLARLREYHLFAASGDPSTGARLETPEPIRMMADVLRNKIMDPVRIENECARARKNVPKLQNKAATAIASILALWKADDYDGALLTAQQARKVSASNADLHCVLGQCYLKVTPAKAELADKAFRQAKASGCTRPELVPSWLEAKSMRKDWAGVIDLHAAFPPTEFRGRSLTLVLNAYLEVARQQMERSDTARALESFKSVFQIGSNSIRQRRAGDQVVTVREQCRDAARNYVHLSDKTSPHPGDRLDVFNAVMDAFVAHVTETWMLELGFASLIFWFEEASRRVHDRINVRHIVGRKLDDLARIRVQLEVEEWLRGETISLLKQVEKQLDRYYRLQQVP